MTGESMPERIVLATVTSLALAVGLRIPDAGAQYYLGAQSGWTGIPYETDRIYGLGSVPVEFNAGYNIGVRGGYQSGPWRVEEEYSYRRNETAEFGAEDLTNGVSGSRYTHSIMTNVLYDLATGWPITPHVGVGIGAMDVFDSLRVANREPPIEGNNWQFAYQAIAGLRYEIGPRLALDLDYRYLATTESTFRVPGTALHYRASANTNNFVAGLTYRFSPAPPISHLTSSKTAPP